MHRSRVKNTALLAGLWLVAGAGAHAQTYSRTETITYYDNTAKWVLGQIASVTCTAAVPASTACDGDVMSSATFDPVTAQQLTASSFGKLQQILAYNADGTIATVKDSNNNVTTLSNWKRGIPQMIQYPATPESPTGAVQSAVVNDNGWIASATDENGYKTCYSYDAMGRLASITYPSGSAGGVCDASASYSTTFSFERRDLDEHGLPAGHWLRREVTGNYNKNTFFDALWRPVLVHEFDGTNTAGTLRTTGFIYDHEGRVTFASYPVNTTTRGATGIWTGYDALGRVTSVSQDSELAAPNNVLTTLTQYLSGFRTQVTNPNGQVTTTSYQAFDQPTYDFPVLILGPQGVVTEIGRDVFGKPTGITRK